MTRITLRPLPTPLPSPEDLAAETTRTILVDEPHAYPCRRCLRDAEPGERVRLLSYDPFTGASPYRQPGPVFVHVDDCAPDVGAGLPEQLTRRTLSLRAFDRHHMMRGGAVVPGSELEEAAATALADPEVAYLHVHNAGPGCFAVRIDRG